MTYKTNSPQGSNERKRKSVVAGAAQQKELERAKSEAKFKERNQKYEPLVAPYQKAKSAKDMTSVALKQIEGVMKPLQGNERRLKVVVGHCLLTLFSCCSLLSKYNRPLFGPSSGYLHQSREPESPTTVSK